jgi:hypothetical protein
MQLAGAVALSKPLDTMPSGCRRLVETVGQQETQCGQFCSGQNPSGCPKSGPYATCLANCNSGKMPTAPKTAKAAAAPIKPSQVLGSTQRAGWATGSGLFRKPARGFLRIAGAAAKA